MKNKLIKLLIIFLIPSNLWSENFNITASNISIDKKNEITVFKDNVKIIDNLNNTINSEFASYDKKKEFLILKENVLIKDIDGNILESDEATYDKKKGLYKTIGKVKILTSSGYQVETSNVSFDSVKKNLFSEEKTEIKDLQNNFIFLENFDYLSNQNIFKSVGDIKVKDKLNNSYKFSQIYIDEKKKEIIGTDSKVFLNDKSFKVNKANKPRVFSNLVNINEKETKFTKSTFTLCDYRDKDKCPPWELKASQMRHDTKKKTIYYDNAVIKVYDIPIFYIPKLQHPDPTVDRRSGFLPPSFFDSKNLGANINIPYFWAINKDKDLTINTRLLATEHPLFLGEYRQAFKKTNFITNFGYTDGYKSKSKKSIFNGDRSHLFAKIKKVFENDSDLEINLQHVSDKKYLKLYRIDTDLVNYETNSLENTISFSHFDDENGLSLGLDASIFRKLTDKYNDKYEYILPELNFNKFLFSENFGYGSIQSNFKIHNYDTNKSERFLINDLDWNYDNSFFSKLYDGRIMAKFKNLNYETKNIEKYKKEPTSEIYGALGYLASIDLFKQKNEKSTHYLTPKILFKYAPEYMKKETGEFLLQDRDIFSLDRLNAGDNFEGGTNLTVGFDYKTTNEKKEFDFSIGQIINENKTNKNMPSSSSLDKRFSDLVGGLNYKNNENFSLNYNYAIDQNYEEMNYNKLSTSLYNEQINFDLNYLKEKINLDDKEYIQSSFGIKSGDNGLFTLSNKRNLVTNSSEFYKLSYEYINDCLRAGLVYRREFYEDSELESENSLMFTITLSPFGSISSPTLSN